MPNREVIRMQRIHKEVDMQEEIEFPDALAGRVDYIAHELWPDLEEFCGLAAVEGLQEGSSAIRIVVGR